MPSTLSCITVESHVSPVAAVIWLHGLGADGHDFESIVPALQLPKNLPVRFIFPHAPKRPVTINGGYVMRAWYDISEIHPDAPQDVDGIQTSEQAIRQLIEQEIQRGIPAANILLVGFSQGGAMALYAGLRYSKHLAGVLVLSAYLPLSDTLAKETLNTKLPIMMAHGIYDTIVPLSFAEESKQQLLQLGCQVHWRTYPMNHELCDAQVRDISQWMQRCLPAL